MAWRKNIFSSRSISYKIFRNYILVKALIKKHCLRQFFNQKVKTSTCFWWHFCVFLSVGSHVWLPGDQQGYARGGGDPRRESCRLPIGWLGVIYDSQFCKFSLLKTASNSWFYKYFLHPVWPISKNAHLSEGPFFKFFNTGTNKRHKRHKININAFSKTILYTFCQSKTTWSIAIFKTFVKITVPYSVYVESRFKLSTVFRSLKTNQKVLQAPFLHNCIKFNRFMGHNISFCYFQSSKINLLQIYGFWSELQYMSLA
jgi:hypothetical protein